MANKCFCLMFQKNHVRYRIRHARQDEARSLLIGAQARPVDAVNHTPGCQLANAGAASAVAARTDDGEACAFCRQQQRQVSWCVEAGPAASQARLIDRRGRIVRCFK